MRVERIGNATLYLGDCSERPAWPRSFAVVTDNPYGMDYDTNNARFTGGEGNGRRGRKRWPRIVGDATPFDPRAWLHHQEVIFWGANHFSSKLPVGSTLVWVKKRAANFGKFLSDGEIGWKKGGHGVYCTEIEWSTQGRRTEGIDNLSVHPAQKPIALMRWCIDRTKAPTIIDPYMGSGTTAIAALQAGRAFVGCEIVPEYFEVACQRVEAISRSFPMEQASLSEAKHP